MYLDTQENGVKIVKILENTQTVKNTVIKLQIGKRGPFISTIIFLEAISLN